MIRTLKLFFWWHFIIKKDSEHKSLEIIDVINKEEVKKIKLRQKLALKLENEEVEVFNVSDKFLKQAGF